jgi:hypothetical protein
MSVEIIFQQLRDPRILAAAAGTAIAARPRRRSAARCADPDAN